MHETGHGPRTVAVPGERLHRQAETGCVCRFQALDQAVRAGVATSKDAYRFKWREK